MHSLAVKIIFPHACLDEGFGISIGIPPLLTRFLFPIFTMGCHKRWFLFCLLVSLWTHFLVCVCGNDMSCTLYLISSRLCWWVTLILILVFSSALPWLIHITLFEPILKLLLLHVAQPFVLCKWYAYCLIYPLALVVCFINSGGATILFCAPVSNTKISY